MFKRLLPLLFLLWVLPAWAQNPTCPTRPLGDSTNACASTAFVNQFATGSPTGTVAPNQPVIGNATSNGFAQGTRSGTTTVFPVIDGTSTNGNCAVFDSSGGLTSTPCTAAGSGTVNSGTIGNGAVYTAGTAVSGWTNGPVYANTMACNGSTDDTAAFQAAVTAAAGEELILPSGVCMVSATVVSAAPILIHGQGAGSGPGIISSQATVIESTNAFTAGDIFQCVSFYQCTFEHIQFNAATQRIGGGAIRIIGGATTGNQGTTNGTTSTSSAVLHFASSPTVNAGLCVYDLTNPNAMDTQTVLSSTGTTVTLSANVSGAVGSGDVVNFYLSGTNCGTNDYSLIHDITFANQYVDIWGTRVSLWDIHHTFHQQPTRASIYEVTTACCELGGGKIHDNQTYEPTPGTAPSGYEIHGGYEDIYANHISGAVVAINIICDTFNCGSIKIEHNVLENATVQEIDLIATNGHSVDLVDIADNETTGGSATFQCMVCITAFTGGGILYVVNIHHNQITYPFSAGTPSCIDVAQPAIGTSMIDHNNCNDLTGTVAFGIIVGTNMGYVLDENTILGVPAGRRYLPASNTLIIDHVGLPFANLPTAASGSQIYVTNSTGGSTCNNSGPGTMGFLDAGTWRCF